jgi:TolB-like protein/Tfp pilus assembly protein PilF
MRIFNNFFEELKERKIRKWAAIYTSTALTILGVFHLFSLRYDLPPYIFDTVLIILVFGLFSMFTAAWFHGRTGRQKTPIIEIIIHSLVFIAAVSVFLKYIVFPSEKISVNIEANSIAVLPFNNLSDSKEDEYFSDGVTEDILTHLSKISGLKVISRTSVMKYKNTEKNIREIGRELGVETILEGSIRRSGNRVRIVGQLIDASNDAHLWSETYDRDLEDIFSVQSEIAEKIAAALQTNLLPLEKELIEVNSTDNIEAYTYYLKGRHYYYNYNDEDNERAIGLFKKALEVDSNYALALAGLADSYNQKVVKYWYPTEWFDSAMVLSSKALKLNSKLPEVYKAIALTYDNLGERELALSNYEKAIKLNPNFATAILNYGHIKFAQAIYDDAFYWYRRANSLEPDNIWAIISIANVYKTLRCDSLAINWGKKAVSLDPNNPFVSMIVADVYLYAGNVDEANRHINKAMKEEKMPLNWFFKSQIETVLGNYELSKKYMDSSLVRSNYSSDPEYFYAHTLIKLNQPEEAMKILKDEELEYVEFLNNTSNAAAILDYMGLAEIYAISNEKEKAFEAWEEAIEKGWLDVRRNTLYPYLENLKEDPKYHKLLNTMQTKINSLKSRIKKEYPEYEICNI